MLMIYKDILLEEGKISQIGSISKEVDINEYDRKRPILYS
ncbi:MAG: hypothetical protein XD91_0277 [Clostridiales bacterium 38_11]|nr:MAG: hypothetical protein XD91_0277 [Clostridiales bacterium 38_11]